VIDNGQSALRDRDKNWQSGAKALRWTAIAFDAIVKAFRRIMSTQHLCLDADGCMGVARSGRLACRPSQA
jgi:hypothetical protein